MMRAAVLYADPPWRFQTWSETRQHKAAAVHYPVMPLLDIASLPVSDIAADDAALFLWSVNSMLPHALALIEAWGFEYRTVAFTWAKQTPTGKPWHFGLGYWTRQNTEQCLLATRGKPKRLARDVPQLLVAPRRQHSRKPDEVYARIERLLGGPYCELFARQEWPGWATAFSNEASKFEAAP